MEKIRQRIAYLLVVVLAMGLSRCNSRQSEKVESDSAVDICIYGGTSAGVMAAYTASMAGKSVVLVEPGRHLGGMSSGGLGYTDIGNKYAISGLARDFYRRIGDHYGKFEQWIFEPKVADSLFQDYINRGDIKVLYNHRLEDIRKEGNVVESITLADILNEGTRDVEAKMFIDCTYEGDLMARAGITYRVGREANSEYNETFNGVQLMQGHQFPDGVDPYKIPGDPSSGLLWGVNNDSLLPAGSGDKKVQAYNFRICLTDDPGNMVPITQPEGYDPEKYDLLIRLMEQKPWNSLQDGFIWSSMPNRKTDINNRNGFSTDMIGMNWDYPEAGYATRAAIWQAHTEYTKGLLYFVGNNPRVPEHIRAEMKLWGYPKDEYTDNGHWSHQLYVREARRMEGALVMTQHHCQGREVVEDGVGMAAYTMDSHNCDRLVVNGMVKNEGNVEEGGFGPYPISYRAITPKKEEAANVLVPVCLSATHIAYGSIRMEPVFMVLGQSAATAAGMAIDAVQAVQDVDVQALKEQLRSNPLADGSPAEILVDDSDADHVEISGNWAGESQGGYGPGFQTAKGPADARIRFIPEIPAEGSYSVYMYSPRVEQASTKTWITIYNGQDTAKKELDYSNLDIVGQTSGEWVSLGRYGLPRGTDSYVEISTEGADGVITADAILFVPD